MNGRLLGAAVNGVFFSCSLFVSPIRFDENYGGRPGSSTDSFNLA